jgi:hypothetical protein
MTSGSAGCRCGLRVAAQSLSQRLRGESPAGRLQAARHEHAHSDTGLSQLRMVCERELTNGSRTRSDVEPLVGIY